MEGDGDLVARSHRPGAFVGDVEVNHAVGGDVQIPADRSVGGQCFGPVEHANVRDDGGQREVVGQVGGHAFLTREGDDEVLLLTRPKFEGVVLEHHLDFKPVPLFFDADGFLEGRRI